MYSHEKLGMQNQTTKTNHMLLLTTSIACLVYGLIHLERAHSTCMQDGVVRHFSDGSSRSCRLAWGKQA